MSDQRYLQSGFDKRLAHAVEECGEFLAAAGKLMRWGPHSVNPEIPRANQETNICWLIRELTDVQQAMARLVMSIQACEYDAAPITQPAPSDASRDGEKV